MFLVVPFESFARTSARTKKGVDREIAAGPSMDGLDAHTEQVAYEPRRDLPPRSAAHGWKQSIPSLMASPDESVVVYVTFRPHMLRKGLLDPNPDEHPSFD
jgi:hypothetical protein